MGSTLYSFCVFDKISGGSALEPDAHCASDGWAVLHHTLSTLSNLYTDAVSEGPTRPLPLEFQGERNRQRRSVSDPACVAFLLAISCLVSAGAWNLVFTFLNW